MGDKIIIIDGVAHINWNEVNVEEEVLKRTGRKLEDFQTYESLVEAMVYGTCNDPLGFNDVTPSPEVVNAVHYFRTGKFSIAKFIVLTEDEFEKNNRFKPENLSNSELKFYSKKVSTTIGDFRIQEMQEGHIEEHDRLKVNNLHHALESFDKEIQRRKEVQA